MKKRINNIFLLIALAFLLLGGVVSTIGGKLYTIGFLKSNNPAVAIIGLFFYVFSIPGFLLVHISMIIPSMQDYLNPFFWFWIGQSTFCIILSIFIIRNFSKRGSKEGS